MVGIAMRQMALCLALPAFVACQAATSSGEQRTTVGESGRKEFVEESKAQIPPGAIQTGDDFYMVPIGKDSDGCEQFRPWSKSLMVLAAIYYRKADGGFTLDYPVADCGTGF